MGISMDKSLEVFWDSFHSFYIFGIQKCKNQHFLWKNIFGCIFIKSNCMCLRTGPGDIKNTKHLKFDRRQIFTNVLKNGKNYVFWEFWKSSVAHVKIVVCFFFYLNLVGKNQQNSIRLFCGGKSFLTNPHFWFHCEILTNKLTAFVKDFFFF